MHYRRARKAHWRNSIQCRGRSFVRYEWQHGSGLSACSEVTNSDVLNPWPSRGPFFSFRAKRREWRGRNEQARKTVTRRDSLWLDRTQSLSFLLVIERLERARCATARFDLPPHSPRGCASSSLQSLNYCGREKKGTARSLASGLRFCFCVTIATASRLVETQRNVESRKQNCFSSSTVFPICASQPSLTVNRASSQQQTNSSTAVLGERGREVIILARVVSTDQNWFICAAGMGISVSAAVHSTKLKTSPSAECKLSFSFVSRYFH